jgi:hypothetical protein
LSCSLIIITLVWSLGSPARPLARFRSHLGILSNPSPLPAIFIFFQDLSWVWTIAPAELLPSPQSVLLYARSLLPLRVPALPHLASSNPSFLHLFVAYCVYVYVYLDGCTCTCTCKVVVPVHSTCCTLPFFFFNLALVTPDQDSGPSSACFLKFFPPSSSSLASSSPEDASRLDYPSSLPGSIPAKWTTRSNHQHHHHHHHYDPGSQSPPSHRT